MLLHPALPVVREHAVVLLHSWSPNFTESPADFLEKENTG